MHFIYLFTLCLKIGVGTLCFYFICVIFLLACVSVYLWVSDAHGDQKGISDPLELELQMVCELPCGGWELSLGPDWT